MSMSTQQIVCEMNNCTRFSDIFWIDASSETNIELGLMQIAKAYNVSPAEKSSARSALQWISQRANWLIVYDSADGHYSVVEKFLPPGNGGNILITSRNAGVQRITLQENAAEVFDMTNEEAVLLLLQSAMVDKAPDHIIDMATKLVSELGGIPLAIDQAGGYMHSCGCSIDDYMELYANHRDELMSSLDSFKGASDYGTSTYGTWDVAMDEIERIATNGIEGAAHAAQSAISLLRMFAFLDHVNIPEELFKNAAENYIERNVDEEAVNGFPLSVNLLDHETLFLGEEGVWDKFQFLSGIQVLLSFSLIKSHNHSYSIHLLVNAWNRSRLPKEEISDLYQKARAVLACSIVLNNDVDNYTFCQMLVPHLRSCALHGLQMKLESTYHHDEYEKFSWIFHRMGDWNGREKLLQITVNERKAMLGYHHLWTLMSMTDLANIYNHQGRWDEAENLHLEVMGMSNSKFGLVHLWSMSSLADIYHNQGRWDEAEKLHLEAINRRKKIGLDHSDTLTSMERLADIYKHQGQWDVAEKLQLEVINTTRITFGLDHTLTLKSMNHLANIYSRQGRCNKAEVLHLKVINKAKIKPGLDHPDTLRSMHDLAFTYSQQGRWDEAEKLELEVMSKRKIKLGLGHPDTLQSMDSLADIYRHQGRWDEAEKLQLEGMGTSKSKLGLDHPDTLGCMNNLAKIYHDQGRWDEAEALHLEVVNATKTMFGLDWHPHTFQSMKRLADIYHHQGRWDKAEKLLLEVMDISNSKLGLKHHDTLWNMNILADIYHDQGRWDEAEKLHLEVMNARKARLGLDHPDTLGSMMSLADIYTVHSSKKMG